MSVTLNAANYHPLITTDPQQSLKSNQRYQTLLKIAQIVATVASIALIVGASVLTGLYAPTFFPLAIIGAITGAPLTLKFIKPINAQAETYAKKVRWDQKVIAELESIPTDRDGILAKLHEYQIDTDQLPQELSRSPERLRYLIGYLECFRGKYKKFKDKEEAVSPALTIDEQRIAYRNQFHFRQKQWSTAITCAYLWHVLQNPTCKTDIDKVVKTFYSEATLALEQFYTPRQAPHIFRILKPNETDARKMDVSGYVTSLDLDLRTENHFPTFTAIKELARRFDENNSAAASAASETGTG